MLKLKMMLCVMMLPLVVVGCTSKQSVSQCVKPPPPAWLMQPPRLADTAERDYFTPQRGGLITMQKQLEGTQKYINEQCRWGCPYRWATRTIIVSNTHALPAEYKMPKVIKPSNPFTNVCWVSVSFNIFCAATNFGCIDSFLCSKTKK